MKIHAFFALSFLIAGFSAEGSSPVSRESLSSIETGKKIEFYWSKPEGTGPLPILILIHPEQESPKIGGKTFVENGQLDYWVGKGWFQDRWGN